MVADSTENQADQNWCQGHLAFAVCDLSDGRGEVIKKVVSGNHCTHRAIEACYTWLRLMIRISEQLGFMKVRARKVCTKDEIGRRERHIKSYSRTNFQQSGLESRIS